MRFTFAPMAEADALAILAWRYPAPYAVYNMSDTPEAHAELLDPRSPHYAARDERGELVGFFAFGTSAEVTGDGEPALFTGDDRTLSVGLGLRPDLAGRGLGEAFVRAGLDFARATFAPERFRLFVLPFNERALRVYERAGFARTGAVAQRRADGDRLFLQLERPA